MGSCLLCDRKVSFFAKRFSAKEMKKAVERGLELSPKKVEKTIKASLKIGFDMPTEAKIKFIHFAKNKMREDLKKLMETGLDWGTISEIYDDLRAAIADLEEIIDS